MDSQGRLRATRYIWTAYFFALLIVNGGILFYAQELGIGHIVLSIFVTLGSVGPPALCGTGATCHPLKRNEESKRASAFRA